MRTPEIPFVPAAKTPRLSRDCCITEKLDGSRGTIFIDDSGELFCGSRNRWITPENDNYTFARWCEERKEELLKLGPGRHDGEFYGQGIQRHYGLKEKRFALFNASRWANSMKGYGTIELRPDAPVPGPNCCSVVPVLYRGEFTTGHVDTALDSGQPSRARLHGRRGHHRLSHRRRHRFQENNPPRFNPKIPNYTMSNDNITELPLPATGLLSVSERLRLQELATAGISPTPPAVEPSMEFPTFEDGSFFKFLPRKGFEPQCLLVAADGQQVAICKNEGVADLICNSLNLFLLATLKNEGPLQILTKPIVIPPPGV